METTKPNDAELLKQIVDLKKINPDLKVVIGVGEYKLFVNWTVIHIFSIGNSVA